MGQDEGLTNDRPEGRTPPEGTPRRLEIETLREICPDSGGTDAAGAFAPRLAAIANRDE